MIEEEALLGSMSVAGLLTHGNVLLTKVVVPKMKHHSNEEGIEVSQIAMPEGSIIVAVSTRDDIAVVAPDTVLYADDKAIVAADSDVLDEVRAVFRAL